jgi:hypothetical protein
MHLFRNNDLISKQPTHFETSTNLEIALLQVMLSIFGFHQKPTRTSAFVMRPRASGFRRRGPTCANVEDPRALEIPDEHRRMSHPNKIHTGRRHFSGRWLLIKGYKMKLSSIRDQMKWRSTLRPQTTS